MSLYDATTTTAAISEPVIIVSTTNGTNAVRRLRLETGALLAILDAAETGSSMERLALSLREFTAELKRAPPREPQPAPFGWREPVAFIESHRRRPLAILASKHRAARRDARRRHRTRWLAELRA